MPELATAFCSQIKYRPMAEQAINQIKCSKCGEKAIHVDEDEEWGYSLRCGECGHSPTGKYWLDSSGPYEEAERILANVKHTDPEIK